MGAPKGAHMLECVLFTTFILDLKEKEKAAPVMKYTDDTKSGGVANTAEDREYKRPREGGGDTHSETCNIRLILELESVKCFVILLVKN